MSVLRSRFVDLAWVQLEVSCAQCRRPFVIEIPLNLDTHKSQTVAEGECPHCDLTVELRVLGVKRERALMH